MECPGCILSDHMSTDGGRRVWFIYLSWEYNEVLSSQILGLVNIGKAFPRLYFRC